MAMKLIEEDIRGKEAHLGERWREAGTLTPQRVDSRGRPSCSTSQRTYCRRKYGSPVLWTLGGKPYDPAVIGGCCLGEVLDPAG
jgi:hypothetical protein